VASLIGFCQVLGNPVILGSMSHPIPTRHLNEEFGGPDAIYGKSYRLRISPWNEIESAERQDSFSIV